MLRSRHYTWPRQSRLRNKKDFQKLYSSGRAFVDGLSVLYVLPSSALQTKIGLAVGKKLGCAVVRNATKRKMREVLRHVRGQLKPGYHLVWMARKPLIAKELSSYYKTLERLAHKARLFLSATEEQP